MTRFSSRPLFRSWVRAWVDVGRCGGEIRLGSGDLLLDVGPQRRLVPFGGQEVVAPGGEHDLARRFILGMERVQADEPAFQIQRRDHRLLRHGDLIGLHVHHRAAQVILAGKAHRRQDRGAATVLGFLAIHHDQLLLGGGTA